MRTRLLSNLGARGGVARRAECIGCVRYTIVNQAAGEVSAPPACGKLNGERDGNQAEDQRCAGVSSCAGTHRREPRWSWTLPGSRRKCDFRHAKEWPRQERSIAADSNGDARRAREIKGSEATTASVTDLQTADRKSRGLRGGRGSVRPVQGARGAGTRGRRRRDSGANF